MNMALLYEVLLPENMFIIFFEVNNACNFEFYDTEELYNELFGFKDTPAFSRTFEDAGIYGSNFVLSIGTLFLFIILFPAWLLIKASVAIILTKVKGPKIKCCEKIFLSDSNALPITFIFLLESCIEIGFACCISIKLMSDERFSTIWEAMSSVLAYWFAVALVVAPIYLVISGLRLYKAFKAKDEQVV